MPDASNPVDPRLLLTQYEASLRQGGVLVSAAGFLFLTLASIFLFYFLPVLPLTVLWAIPIGFPIVFGVLILLAAQRKTALARAYAVETQYLASLQPNGILGLLAAAPFAIYAALYGVVLYYCGREIYPFSHLMGVGFIVFYVALAALLVAGWVAVGSHGAPYAPVETHPDQATGAGDFASPRTETQNLASLRGSAAGIWRWIVPYPRAPFDGRIFLAGFLAPILLEGLNGSRWAIINLLFRDRHDWNTLPDVPLLAIAAFGLVVYIIFEVLLHQAAMIWAAERNGGGAHGTTSAHGAVGAHGAPYAIVIRWLLALLLAALIDARGLLTLALVISVYHAVNILLLRSGAPAGSGRLPVLRLLFEALGLPLRFAAGVMVWGNPSWDYSAYAFMGVIVFFLGLGLTAGRWRKEGLALQNQDVSLKSYFTERGAYWRRVGLWAAFFSGLLLLIMQNLSESCAIRPGSTFASFYAACPYHTTTLIYTRLDKFSSLFIAFDMALLVLILTMLIVWGLQGPLARLNASARPFNPLMQPAYLLVGLAVAFAALVSFHSLAWAAFGVMIGIVGLTLREA